MNIRIIAKEYIAVLSIVSVTVMINVDSRLHLDGYLVVLAVLELNVLAIVEVVLGIIASFIYIGYQPHILFPTHFDGHENLVGGSDLCIEFIAKLRSIHIA